MKLFGIFDNTPEDTTDEPVMGMTGSTGFALGVITIVVILALLLVLYLSLKGSILNV